MMDTEWKLREYIKKSTQTEVDSETPLIEQGIIDSMGVMDLIAFIQSSFHVEFTDDDLTAENFENIHSIAVLIEGKNEHGSPGRTRG